MKTAVTVTGCHHWIHMKGERQWEMKEGLDTHEKGERWSSEGRSVWKAVSFSRERSAAAKDAFLKYNVLIFLRHYCQIKNGCLW